MIRNIEYATAEEFFAANKPRIKISGIELYGSYQIARACGCTPRTVQRYVNDGTFEEKFGITEIVRDPLNGRFFFTEDAIRKLYQKYIVMLLRPESLSASGDQ